MVRHSPGKGKRTSTLCKALLKLHLMAMLARLPMPTGGEFS
jgi:hypothetical protein